jgi:hypothetical protein
MQSKLVCLVTTALLTLAACDLPGLGGAAPAVVPLDGPAEDCTFASSLPGEVFCSVGADPDGKEPDGVGYLGRYRDGAEVGRFAGGPTIEFPLGVAAGRVPGLSPEPVVLLVNRDLPAGAASVHAWTEAGAYLGAVPTDPEANDVGVSADGRVFVTADRLSKIGEDDACVVFEVAFASPSSVEVLHTTASGCAHANPLALDQSTKTLHFATLGSKFGGALDDPKEPRDGRVFAFTPGTSPGGTASASLLAPSPEGFYDGLAFSSDGAGYGFDLVKRVAYDLKTGGVTFDWSALTPQLAGCDVADGGAVVCATHNSGAKYLLWSTP